MASDPDVQRRWVEKQWAVDPVAYRAKRREWLARWRAANPEKHKANKVVHRAVKSGLLVRADHCERCGVACRAEASHDDYADPLVVEWLCRLCHMRKDLKGRRRPRLAACHRGHLFDEANTYVTPDGRRQCRVCNRLNNIRRSSERSLTSF